MSIDEVEPGEGWLRFKGGSDGLPARALSLTNESNKDDGAIDDGGGSGVPALD